MPELSAAMAQRAARSAAAVDGLKTIIRSALPEDQAFILLTFERGGAGVLHHTMDAPREDAIRHLEHAAEVLKARQKGVRM